MITPAKYDAGFGPEPSIVRETVDIIDAHSRPGDAVFVWGRAPWVYSLSHRLPAGRYTSLNSSYTLDPLAQPLLLSELRAHPPAVMVQLEALPAAVTAFLHELQYNEIVPTSPDGEICWVLPGQQLNQVPRRDGRSVP